jgi:hypothetical protein
MIIDLEKSIVSLSIYDSQLGLDFDITNVLSIIYNSEAFNLLKI